jgi:hypothetical protein
MAVEQQSQPDLGVAEEWGADERHQILDEVVRLDERVPASALESADT